jgi:hypothetical protein
MSTGTARPATVADVLDAAADQARSGEDIVRTIYRLASPKLSFDSLDALALHIDGEHLAMGGHPDDAVAVFVHLSSIDQVNDLLRRVADEQRNASRIHDPDAAFDTAHIEYRDRARCDGGPWCSCRGNDGLLKLPPCPQRDPRPCTRDDRCWRGNGHGGDCQPRQSGGA